MSYAPPSGPPSQYGQNPMGGYMPQPQPSYGPGAVESNQSGMDRQADTGVFEGGELFIRDAVSAQIADILGS